MRGKSSPRKTRNARKEDKEREIHREAAKNAKEEGQGMDTRVRGLPKIPQWGADTRIRETKLSTDPEIAPCGAFS